MKINLSDRYGGFLRVNIWRIIITRVFSLIYVMLIARMVDVSIQDTMIVLAYIQSLVVQLSLFGLGISAVYVGRAHINDDGMMQVALKSAFIFSLSFVMGSLLIVHSLIELSWLSFLLYISVIVLQLIFEYLNIYNEYKIRTDRKIKARAIYSVMNSIIVPSIFLLYSSIEGVLMAWNYAMIIPIIYLGRDFKSLFISGRTDFKTMREIIRSGMPVYLANWLNLVAQKLDIFMIYTHQASGESARYYWMLKISAIGQEIFMIMINGLFSILVVANKQKSRENFIHLVHSLMRVSLLFGFILYTLLIAYGRVVIIILVSDKFMAGLIILQLITLGRSIDIPATILVSVSNAEGKLSRIMWMSIYADGMWMVSVFIMIRYGAIGLAIALVINRSIQSSYMLWTTRGLFTGAVRDFYRILAFIITITLLSFVSGYMLIIMIPVIIYITRPLNMGDWEFIVGVIPLMGRYTLLRDMMVK